MKSDLKIDLVTIARKVVNDCLRVKAGEYFLISCGDDYYFKFCEEVAVQAIKVGAYPFIKTSTDRLFRTVLDQSIQYLKKPGRFGKALAEFVDVELMVAFSRNPDIAAGADPKKLAAMAIGGKPTQDMMYERNKDTANLRKASFLYPTPEQAMKYGMPFEEYSDLVWGALDIDYDRLRERAKRIAKVMKGAQNVHITNDEGSDLTFSIKDRPPFIDDGVFDEEDKKNNVYMMNLPTGEVCIAPVETSAEGTACFGFNRFMGHDLKDLRIDFNGGKIVNIEGKEGADYYKKVLESQTGDKDYIAELGIGLNPRITKVTGELALDEKIIGTIHIATGENRMMHGKGVSSFHWDLVMNRPTLKIDDVIVMENGEYKI
ncbi:MAG: aminopeptidase [Candidatus Eremiobacteraeota bacterium]|nr:aminopeptidase [Candidatus Eremiobacteraeota bacterium]